jgi:hypothetical protein
VVDQRESESNGGHEPVEFTIYHYGTPGGPSAAELAKGCAADGTGTWSAP